MHTRTSLIHHIDGFVRHELIGDIAVAQLDAAFYGFISVPHLVVPFIVFLESLQDEQAIVNNFFTDIEHPIAGKARLLNSPVQFSETPAKIKNAAPPVGSHTEEVLLEHGYSWEDMERFKEQGAIP